MGCLLPKKACCDDLDGEVVQAVNAAPSKDIHWLGFVEKHRANPGSWFDDLPQIQKSKCVSYSANLRPSTSTRRCRR